MKALKLSAVFNAISPYSHEQHLLSTKLCSMKLFGELHLYVKFLKCFMDMEVVNWSKMQEVYQSELQSLFVFDKTTLDGVKRWNDLHSRVIEHVVSPLIFRIFVFFLRTTLESLLRHW